MLLLKALLVLSVKLRMMLVLTVLRLLLLGMLLVLLLLLLLLPMLLVLLIFRLKLSEDDLRLRSAGCSRQDNERRYACQEKRHDLDG